MGGPCLPTENSILEQNESGTVLPGDQILHLLGSKQVTLMIGSLLLKMTDAMYVQWLDLRYKYLSLTADIRNMLISLGKKYILALITNGTSNAQWEKIDKLDLRPLFDLILVSGDLPWEKPNPQIFREACDNLEIEPHQVIMVGDKLETDISGGINSKFAGNIWIPLEDNKLRQNDPVPDFILKDVIELKYLMPKIKNGVINRVSMLQLSDVEDSNSNSSDGS